MCPTKEAQLFPALYFIDATAAFIEEVELYRYLMYYSGQYKLKWNIQSCECYSSPGKQGVVSIKMNRDWLPIGKAKKEHMRP